MVCMIQEKALEGHHPRVTPGDKGTQSGYNMERVQALKKKQKTKGLFESMCMRACLYM